MTLSSWILVAQWFFLMYFIGINIGYIALNLLSFVNLKRHAGSRSLDHLPRMYSGFEPPVSILVPAYNEAATIAASVRSLLQLNYSQFEIIVINDGSKDDTLAVLQREFALIPFPEAYRIRIPTKRVRGIYRSTVHPSLRVIDKDNGGKADALNAGINAARCPLYCAVDADSILQRDSLQRVVRSFIEDPSTVAAGGSVRIANGCIVSGGFLTKIGLPRNPLVLFQLVEYMRAFLFGRLGWLPLNAVLIISGAFGLFKLDTVVAAGGYRTDTVGEDMELVVRLHRMLRPQQPRYRIAFAPDAICWTEAPETLSVLKNQRMRWQRGLAESFTLNMGLLFGRNSGAAGWLAFPFMSLFEWWGPLIEVTGYVFILTGFMFGLISPLAFTTFMVTAFGFGLLLSVSALLLEELSFHIYPRAWHLAALVAIAIAENFGYRQLISCWRLIGLVRWVFGAKAKWGDMKRSASWRREV